jgi:Xaa-Pro aminopeptidase
VDLGVTSHGYSSDIQRCWYVAAETGEAVPQDVVQAAAAVNRAISSGAALLKPGVLGWQVDDAARTSITSDGYPEYKHALGHQVGKVAHDGGAILGPRWARYGRTPEIPIREGEVYTLELGVTLPGRGYLGLEEMVVVTADGCKFLSQRQFEIPSIPRV